MSAFKSVLCNKFLVTVLQFTGLLHQDKMSHHSQVAFAENYFSALVCLLYCQEKNLYFSNRGHQFLKRKYLNDEKN